MRFLVDENLPFSLAQYLRKEGYEVLDASRGGFPRGTSDEDLWKLAARKKCILLTKDLDFPLPQIYPHPLGLVLIRVPDTFSAQQVTSLFARSLDALKLRGLEKRITVITLGQIRVRPLE
ncbi:MAG: DUF5615 family PIN-like protein [Deltaproteobacteria bacterium]|nr:DUF5615 family PIN-like protein [Deltaproteobacteria bacterium]